MVQLTAGLRAASVSAPESDRGLNAYHAVGQSGFVQQQQR
jgi:hypothetical protein